MCFPADPPGVYEAAARISELRSEERRAASRRRRLVGRPSVSEAADQRHGCRREPRLLLPPSAAAGETAHTHTHTRARNGSLLVRDGFGPIRRFVLHVLHGVHCSP